MEEKQKLWTKNFMLALIITIGVNLCCNLLLSIISIYATQLTNTNAYTGIMTGAFTLASLFIRVFAGKMLDKIGRKKILLLGIAVTSIATIGYVFSNGIYSLIFLRAMQGIGFGISSTAIATIVTDVTPQSRLLEGIGYSGVGITITTAIGPSIAMYIVGSDYTQFKLLFISTFIVSMLTMAISFIISYENKVKKCEKKKEEDISTCSLNKEIIIPSIVLGLAAISESTIMSFTALYGIELGFNNIGTFFLINALGILVSRVFINKIVNKFGMNTVLSVGLFIFAVMIFGMSIAQTSLMLNIFGFFCGIMMGSLLPIINVMIINSVDESMKGMANAIYYALLDGGYGIGSILWGKVVISLGYRPIYSFAAIVLMIAFLVFTAKLMHIRVKDHSRSRITN